MLELLLCSTLTILPEQPDRVEEVFVTLNEEVDEGQPLFQLDQTQQAADVRTAQTCLAELAAAEVADRARLAEAEASIARAQLEIELPARRETAAAELAEAQVSLDKTTARAGVSGRLQQFSLRPGDIVNPFIRPAGILIPTERRTACGAHARQGWGDQR